MTSGRFHRIDIESIIVNRDERQRRKLTGVDELADSIKRTGLIHPIVITPELVLVAGERRLAACKKLGLKQITAQYVDEADAPTRKAIELEENVRRKDIDDQDRLRAIREYHLLRTSEERPWTEPEWTEADTARALGFSRSTINEALGIANEIAKGNERIAKEKDYSAMRNIYRTQKKRHADGVLWQIVDELLEKPPISEEDETIQVRDFNEWVKTDLHKAPRFNFIHCDFPYGIGADSFNQGAAGTLGGYTDTRETWDRLMDSLAAVTRTTESCHLMFWFAMRKGDQRLYESTAQRLEQMGWVINPMPLIWMKSDGSGIIPVPNHDPRQIYETCFLGTRGERRILLSKPNAYAWPMPSDRLHMSEKPEEVLTHFFEMVVDEHTVMLDPTCGSGSSIRAAEALGAKYALGLEINREFAQIARDARKMGRLSAPPSISGAAADTPKGRIESGEPSPLTPQVP
jgi:ParB/RepB/Spo0J family partition protein